MLVMLAATNLSAAPLNLTQVPAGNGGSEPAPNVILSIDDSGSMGWDVNGCRTALTPFNYYGNWHDLNSTGCSTDGTASNQPARITALKDSLRAQFGDGTANSGLLADDRIRLSWQAMHNNGGASNAGSLTVGNTNAMKRFSGAHRTNFNAFVTSLTPSNGTPSHIMMSQAYNFMKSGASLNSPWASNPGTTEQPYLACRRSYHIFMTDGAWNGAESKDQSGNTINGGNALRIPITPNFDGSAQTLPTTDSSLKSSLNLSDAPPYTPPTSYTPPLPNTNNTIQTRVYSDQWGAGTATNAKASTLADYAFRSWAEDLQSAIPNAIPPKINTSVNERITSDTNSTTLEPFWNPKNDPATWQHLTQHTIGFGNTASTWPGSPLWKLAANDPDDTYGGDYPKLVNGLVTWQNPVPWAATNNDTNSVRPSELWHAALNGRGKFYPARNPAALNAAFSDILNNILSDTSNPLTTISSDGASLSTNSKSYVAGYNALKWSGRLKAFPINQTTGVLGATETWSATGLGALNAAGKFVVNDPGKLDDPTYPVGSRFVASYNGASGIEWKTYSSLPLLQKTPLNSNLAGTDNKGQDRVDYIRGDRSKEQSQTGGVFRNRDSRLGDIVNSKILYLGKPVSNYGDTAYQTFKRPAGSGSRANMLYVGANDGMLHGFEASSGVEKLAYIPQGIAQGDLRKLTDPTYIHQYFVDGTPFSGDAKVGSSSDPTNNPWKTVLVSGLGGGGKGYIALDVTNPANFIVGNVGSLVIADTTASTDADMGNMYITPAIDPSDASKSSQIVRLNAPTSGTAPNEVKHRWALVVGNGYNSTNEAPVLIVQYLDGSKEIKKISPCIAPATGVFDTACAYKTNTGLTSNGLSTPRLVDLNDDGIVDVAYAGDLLGNVWKFDLSSQTPAEWKTSFTSEPLFKAKAGQSFTTAPYIEPNFTAGSGVQVHISSGKNLTTADQTSNIIETTYSLWDNSTFGPVVVNPNATPLVYKFTISDLSATRINTSNAIPSTLIEQTISTTPVVDSGNTYYTSSSNSVNYDRASTPDRGWFMDWKQGKQRVLRNSKSFDGQKISIYSTIPSSATIADNVETCTPGLNSEKNFLTILNMFTGKPSKALAYDLSDTIAAATRASTTTVELPPGDFVEVKTRNANGKRGGKVVSVCKEGQVCKPPIDTPWGSYVGVKAGWREKQ